MSGWLVSLIESLVPTLLQFLVNQFAKQPQTVAVQSKLQAHTAALNIINAAKQQK